MTDKVAREINAGHVIRIREALDGAPSVGAPKSRPARWKAEVAVASTVDNPWASVLAKAERYRLDRRPMTLGAVAVTALRQCGLPPDVDLTAFGDPHLVGLFKAAPDARAKARTSWSLCEKWIVDNIVNDFRSSVVAAMRERAWTFLFGVRHGFAHEIRMFDRVMFPSPWKPDEYVVAHLRS